MNRRLKLPLFLLLAAALCLIAAIVSHRFSVPQNGQPDTGTQQSAQKTAVTLFEQNGLWGAKSPNGIILIEPTWYYLHAMSDSVLIARRNTGKNDAYGLITANGEQLVPFLYHAITQIPSASDLWLATFKENGKTCCHLYHADGTRWSDTAWDACSYEEGLLTLKSGSNVYTGSLTHSGIRWRSLHVVYPVGLHELTMDFDESVLDQLPPADTLQMLGEAAAAYLRYLFVTKTPPESSLISAESKASILVDHHYLNSRLTSAHISRIKARDTEGLPAYFVQVQVSYQRQTESDGIEIVHTAMLLNINQNAAGAFTYNSFFDSQMHAAQPAI